MASTTHSSNSTSKFADSIPLERRHSINSVDSDPVGVYFHGPHDTTRHSRWPVFLRIRGSVVPAMILPLTFITLWSTCITCISQFVYPKIGIDSVLLTVLGFVVGLCLSFRGSTAYERYSEGRRYWSQLSSIMSSFARLIWLNADERPESATEDLLAKISFCNMLVALAIALKHRMRFEPFTHYDDLQQRVSHLSLTAHRADVKEWKEPSPWKKFGMLLGLPMAESNPRKLIKNPNKPLGNAPLEIHGTICEYIKHIIDNGTFKTPACQTQAYNCLAQINDVLNGSDRVLNTPLPLAYSIALAQITWVYILILPFQLVNKLGWVTIPGSMFAAYIILGLALIGKEIENPFGEDVNDLALDDFCNQIEQDVNIIMTYIPGSMPVHMEHPDNNLLYPLASGKYEDLLTKSPEYIRSRLHTRAFGRREASD